jgi:hypothetical protein
MTSISSELIVGAAIGVEQMTLEERLLLADEIHAEQPNLLYSVIVLHRFGATLAQIEVILGVLFVFYMAMKNSGRTWPVITEDAQDRCLKRIAGRMRFIEGLTLPQQTQTVADVIIDHPEQPMLAYIIGKLREHSLLVIESEAQEKLMLVVLNLVECIAQAAPGTTGEGVAL